MWCYYNEFDPGAAAWCRELIAAGLMPPGVVDERSITEVRADEIRQYDQWHFFAGIGGWPLTLALAGHGTTRSVLTGSCPCQPFSAAGKRKGTGDERHLWPHLARLIGELRPAVCLGEQVASADGRRWLAGVRADLEGMGYRVGAADLCAAGAGEVVEGWVRRGDQMAREPVVVGAPHIRQRLFWGACRLADGGRDERRPGRDAGADDRRAGEPSGLCVACRLADGDDE